MKCWSLSEIAQYFTSKWSLDISKDFLVAKKVASLKWACPLGGYSWAPGELRNTLVSLSKMFSHIRHSWCVKGSFCVQSFSSKTEIACHQGMSWSGGFIFLILYVFAPDLSGSNSIWHVLECTLDDANTESPCQPCAEWNICAIWRSALTRLHHIFLFIVSYSIDLCSVLYYP